MVEWLQTSGEEHPLHQDDLDLVAGVLQRRPGALDRFQVRMRCVPRILAAKNARMGAPLSSEDLEDLTQETLIAVWERLGTFAGLAKLETWVYRFCHHQLSNRLRALARAPNRVEPAPEPMTAQEVPASLRFEHLYKALDRLGSPDADVIRLKHLEHLTFEEIGARRGVSPNTAKTQYYRGMTRLRELLGEERGSD